ncbi:MAG: hypothetical protein QW160_04505 [Candidatus Bathyarchaeia archaeon]
MRRIFFIKPIIERMRSGDPPFVTFRRQRKAGLYMVCGGGRFHPKPEGIVIKVWRSCVVSTGELTDQDARDAGLSSLDELLGFFKKWYGEVPAKMYKNWFVIVEPEELRNNGFLERKVRAGCFL